MGIVLTCELQEAGTVEPKNDGRVDWAPSCYHQTTRKSNKKTNINNRMCISLLHMLAVYQTLIQVWDLGPLKLVNIKVVLLL